jgi:hypothetical protein
MEDLLLHALTCLIVGRTSRPGQCHGHRLGVTIGPRRDIPPAERHSTTLASSSTRRCVAVGHTILVALYHMLRDGATYEDLGPLYFDERDRRATVGRSVRRLEALGYRVTLEPRLNPSFSC